ncbi:MAG: BMP family ABC transporter substrate-binding protein [bacterium]|nr:BMP family ABC transporter substrate-binding protein [bacterium]
MKKQNIIITAVVAIVVVILAHLGKITVFHNYEEEALKVGFLYVGDSCNAYTENFIKAQKAIGLAYGERVETYAKYNVAEGQEEAFLQELVDDGCRIIFTTSYGYENITKEFAKEYPNIQFCQATGDNSATEPVLSNYHTYMGEIYQGRYISGVVAGMKMNELIDSGRVSAKEAKIGYVGAFPYAEVISGYTAFFLGVRSVVPTATMEVRYTYSWGDYELEKKYAKQFIKEGCVIISQHSDTTGPAVACEEYSGLHPVFHVGYNVNMADVAPTTSLIGCRVNWAPYMVSAVGAVLEHKPIEDRVKGSVHGTDVSRGFDGDWVQMLSVNDIIAAEGTKEKVSELIDGFKKCNIEVFKGDYIGVNPENTLDTCDLRQGYVENEKASAPSFHYVLKDVISIVGEGGTS